MSSFVAIGVLNQRFTKVSQFPNCITEGIIHYSEDFCKATTETYKNIGYRKINITLFEFSDVSSWTPIFLQINWKWKWQPVHTDNASHFWIAHIEWYCKKMSE